MELHDRQAFEAAVAAQQPQTQAGIGLPQGQAEHLDGVAALQAVGQKALQVARLLAGKFPAQQGNAAIGREGQHQGLCFNRQDDLGRRWVVAQGHRLIEMQAAQQGRANNFHGTIGLDQQQAVWGQGFPGLLPLQFGIGTHGGGPLGHQ